MVAMAHPDRTFALQVEVFKKRTRLPHRQQFGMPELPLAGGNHLTAEMAAHQLHAVADPQNRHAKLEQLLGHRRRAIFVNRLGAARQDDPVGSKAADFRH